MDDYKPNSYKHKETLKGKPSIDEKKVEKIVTGVVKTKKKTGVQKLTDVFISEDTTKVKSFILMDVLIPAAKKAVYDIVTNGIDMILYGETGHSKKYHGAASKVSYRDYNEISKDRRPYRSSVNKSTYSYDDIVLETKGEAEAVIMGLEEIIDTYSVASVADLYDLVGVTGSYTDNNYGWTDISSAQTVRVRDGYLLKFPRALPID